VFSGATCTKISDFFFPDHFYDKKSSFTIKKNEFFWTPSWVGKSDKIRSDQVRSGQIRSEHGQTRARQDKDKSIRPNQSGQDKQPRQGTIPSRRGRAGFTPHIRMCPPLDPGPPRSEGVAGTFSNFFAIMVPFFFPSFFRCHFWSILARFCVPSCLPKSTKIVKNRCQDAFPC